jgi:hypothetical protein
VVHVVGHLRHLKLSVRRRLGLKRAPLAVLPLVQLRVMKQEVIFCMDLVEDTRLCSLRFNDVASLKIIFSAMIELGGPEVLRTTLVDWRRRRFECAPPRVSLCSGHV